jgi:TatD DNase family protein
MLIDAHTHLDRYLFKRFGKDITSVLEQIEEYKILTISNSMDLTSYVINRRISRRSKYIVPAFGIHPWNAYRYVAKTDLVQKLIRESKIIGEIGLDHSIVENKSRYPSQRKIFELFLSKTKNKVISLHTKGAERDVLDLLRTYGNNRVIIHWYSGSLAILKEMAQESYYFSISPEIKFSDHIKKIVKEIPLDQILTETDNPGGPQRYIGKKGMPILVKDVVEEIAIAKEKSSSQIEEIVQENFARLVESDASIHEMLV